MFNRFGVLIKIMLHYKGNFEVVWIDWSSYGRCNVSTVLFEHANQLKILFKILFQSAIVTALFSPLFVCGYGLSYIPCLETAVRCTSHLL